MFLYSFIKELVQILLHSKCPNILYTKVANGIKNLIWVYIKGVMIQMYIDLLQCACSGAIYLYTVHLGCRGFKLTSYIRLKCSKRVQQTDCALA